MLRLKYEQWDLKKAKDELRGILRRVRKVPPDKEDDFAINQQDMLTNLYKSLTTGLYAVAIGIGAISLLVGGIGIMNIMLVAVTERTREIGVRKAIGAKRRDILMQFLVESIALSLSGGVLGILLGIFISFALSQWAQWNTLISPTSIVLSFGFATAVGLFFGIYPARKASRLDPIIALRYE